MSTSTIASAASSSTPAFRSTSRWRPAFRAVLSGTRSLLLGLVLTLALLLAIEAVLRFGFHYPRGYFRFMASDGVTLYPPSSTLPMRWGAIPYEVRTNALGFRGDELALVAPAGRTRILALGDSVTDGFFVDNDATYPAQLQRFLREKGRDVEVVNAARGGGSIDKEYAILREHGFPLRPDVVVLTFVTNDVFDIRERSLDNLLTRDLHPKAQTFTNRLLTDTALGEWTNDLTLRLRFRAYRAADRPGGSGALATTEGEGQRYDLWHGDHFAENVRVFRQLTKNMDGMVLDPPFSAEVTAILEKYLAILDHLHADCTARGADLFFVYFPAYSQVYDPEASLAIRDFLQAACAERHLPFVDLTEPFRTEGKDHVLHLAPVDFHPNPAGLRLMAHVIGERLLQRTSAGQ
jgi:lysophospholipase L1-like esterase